MKKVLTVALAAMCSGSLFAAESGPYSTGPVTVGLSTGILTDAKNKELVYTSGGSKLSQLNWDIGNSPIVNASIKWQILPRLNFNARGWTTLSSNGSSMTDYDWLNSYDRNELTDMSSHPRTKLHHANEFDVNLEGLLLNKDAYKLGILAGYQETRYSFTAYGGSYAYSSVDADGNYAQGTALSNTGSFEDEAGISYQQKYKTPYFGLSGQFKVNKFSLSALAKYSPWVDAQDFDHHIARSTEFVAKAKNGTYYGFNINAGYEVLPSTTLFAEYTWNKYKKNTGTLTSSEKYTNANTGGDIVFTEHYTKGTSGISNEYSTVNVGVNYTF